MHADGVSILNLSAHNFRRNGLYWDGADRFRASYVTVWNVGEYGIYVEDGEQGVVDNAYVSGAARRLLRRRVQAVRRDDLETSSRGCRPWATRARMPPAW